MDKFTAAGSPFEGNCSCFPFFHSLPHSSVKELSNISGSLFMDIAREFNNEDLCLGVICVSEKASTQSSFRIHVFLEAYFARRASHAGSNVRDAN